MMTKTPEQFWEEVSDMTRTPGFANIVGEFQKLTSGINVDACDSVEKLWFMKGQLDVLRMVLALPVTSRKMLSEIEAQKEANEDPEA